MPLTTCKSKRPSLPTDRSLRVIVLVLPCTAASTDTSGTPIRVNLRACHWAYMRISRCRKLVSKLQNSATYSIMQLTPRTKRRGNKLQQ